MTQVTKQNVFAWVGSTIGTLILALLSIGVSEMKDINKKLDKLMIDTSINRTHIDGLEAGFTNLTQNNLQNHADIKLWVDSYYRRKQ